MIKGTRPFALYLNILANYFLRHLTSLSIVLDGNHHANRYKKNTDDFDCSIWKGVGYFAVKDDYKEYINAIPTKNEVRYAVILLND
jgi:hypothetical protein